jgi:hypothetical protein
MTNSLAMQNVLANAAAAASAFSALFSTVPGTSAGTEISGGSPAYARLALVFPTATTGATTAGAVTHNVASGTTIAGAGTFSALTAGTYEQGVAVTSQTLSSQGTYQVTYTQTGQA